MASTTKLSTINARHEAAWMGPNGPLPGPWQKSQPAGEGVQVGTMHAEFSRHRCPFPAVPFQRLANNTSPIQGSAQFAADFSRSGPRDHKGRSLRDLDLNHRLLKYPLSYLIYSAGFDGLPSNVKSYVARRLGEILTGRDNSPAFAHLTPDDRQAILEILQDTKPGFLDIPTNAGK